ncbi:MAG: double-strand break repair protein AddB [Methylovirgula sp.]
MPIKHVFSIAPGAPFLKSFVAALLEGRIVEGFSRALGALDLAEATIYVPTRRAARALVDEFAGALDRPATLLPRILPLGGLEATQTNLLFEEAALESPLGAAQAASEVWRRMRLAALVQKWALALRHAIVSVNADGSFVTDAGESCLVGTSAADAWHLAGALADLIDELIIEDVGWEKLDPLALPEFDQYWRITLDFLNIAVTQWPTILAAHGLVDTARRQQILVEAQIARIEAGRAGPVIAMGSTGTNRATARLLAAIAAAPRGAVVLPGLDLWLDEPSWRLIGDTQADEPGFGHPQAALRRLLPILGVERDSVIELGAPAPARGARDKFFSGALRPAATTEMWRLYRDRRGEIAAALEGVTLIEAADEREEALSLAIALRQVLETPGATAALATPDRELARRVGAELRRFGVEIDDSAGEPLSASLYGRLARLTMLASSGEAADLVALLAHPLTQLGLVRADIERLAPLFEIGVLRQLRPLPTAPAEAISAARRAAAEHFAHPAQKRIGEDDWAKLEDLLVRLQSALAPLVALTGAYPLRTWIEAHRHALDAVTHDARGEDAEAFDALLCELHRCALPDLRFDAEAYALFLDQTMAEVILRQPRRTHPRLKILGLLEARLMDAGVMLLGGLDETIWPPQVQSDAFLNRPMRAALGLTPPERKIGQTAHDFVMAMGHERVILSRALKRNGTPTVASRFVQRLATLAGDQFEPCRARGRALLALAGAIDRPAAPASGKRPMPRPPVELRPSRLSVTRIETLRRDPYAIYAEFILKLVALPGADEAEERRILGSAIHEVLAEFGARYSPGVLPAEAASSLAAMMRAAFREQFANPDFAIFQWPRIERAMRFYLDFETRRRPLVKLDMEIDGKIDIPLADGTQFTLSAKADRLEHRAGGAVTLVDYKTGTPPGMDEVRVGFAPQLTLEAAMARRGAFGLPPDTHVEEALYVKLLGKDGGKERPLRFRSKGKEDESIAEVAEKHFADLRALLDQFRDPATPYLPRPFPKYAARHNDYDHLARVKEWALGNGQ